MKAFYPSTTSEIIHKGAKGNIYILDGIEKCISIYQAISHEDCFNVVSVNANDKENEGTELIEKVHSPEILASYKTGKPESLANSSGIMWQPKLYDYVIEQALVSKMAIGEAENNTGAIVITGGGHHAEKSTPYGFCPINTMALAALEAKDLGHRVAIIDLDTHYSNGCFDILSDVQNIKIYSLWNQKLDKWQYYESKGNIWHRKVESVEDYFAQLEELIKDINGYAPNFIIYHLGLDVLETDRLGGVKGMTKNKLLERDEKISDLIVNKLKTKFVIFIGGAYINRALGEESVKQQKFENTQIQLQILKNYCSTD